MLRHPSSSGSNATGHGTPPPHKPFPHLGSRYQPRSSARYATASVEGHIAVEYFDPSPPRKTKTRLQMPPPNHQRRRPRLAQMHGRVSISVQAGEPYDTSTVNDDRNDPGDDSNFTATHGRVSIGVQAGEPYDTSTVSDDRNNPAELKDPNVGRYVSIGVDAGQPMEKRVPFSSYLQGASHITVNGGDFRTIYELPEEVERLLFSELAA